MIKVVLKLALYDERIMSDARVGRTCQLLQNLGSSFLWEISCGFECSQKLAHGVCKLSYSDRLMVSFESCSIIKVSQLLNEIADSANDSYIMEGRRTWQLLESVSGGHWWTDWIYLVEKRNYLGVRNSQSLHKMCLDVVTCAWLLISSKKTCDHKALLILNKIAGSSLDSSVERLKNLPISVVWGVHGLIGRSFWSLSFSLSCGLNELPVGSNFAKLAHDSVWIISWAAWRVCWACGNCAGLNGGIRCPCSERTNSERGW